MSTTIARKTGLWPHQVTAVDSAVAALRDGGRATVVMACGTGKTIVGAEASRQLAPCGRVLIVVPTIALVDQTATAHARHLGQEAGLIAAVCSDASSTTEAELVRHDLEEIGAYTTLDPAELATRVLAADRTTVITTYASLTTIATAHDLGAPRWDLIIIDEAHRSAGRQDRSWSVIHDDAAIPADRRLYLTATPRVMSSETLDTYSMDDPTVFGPEVFRLPFGTAIGLGLLADYRLVVAIVTDEDVAALTATGATVQVGGFSLPADMVAAQIALLRASTEYGLHRAITYHQRVYRAERFAETLHATAVLLRGEVKRPVIAEAISGEDSPAHRRQVLRKLELAGDRLVVVSNARVLAEGVDVPELDAVMFADPRDSTTDVVQAVGRALRRGARPDKTATIIVPIFLNAAESPEAALEGSQFDVVFRVVRALRAHDERLADWLDEQRVRYTRENPPQSERGAHELPEWLTAVGPAWSTEFAQAVLVRTVQMSTSSWWAGLSHAQAYRAEHGDLDVPRDHVTASGFNLGTWIVNARSARSRGAMPAARVAALDEIGMIWNTLDQKFATFLDHCRAYREEYGDLLVPQAHTVGRYRLGSRINTYRRRHAQGALPPEQVAALEELGMVWNTRDEGTQEMLAHARAYRAEHGHLRVRKDYVTAGGYPLGRALAVRRGRHKEGSLPADHVAALEELGMVWGDIEWSVGLEAAARYAGKHGDLRVRGDYIDEQGYRLGDFIAYYRALAAGTVRDKHGRPRPLLPERREALEELGMVWQAAPQRREATAEEIAALRALPGRGGQLNRAIVELVDAGVMPSSIAEGLGVTRGAISGRLKSGRLMLQGPAE